MFYCYLPMYRLAMFYPGLLAQMALYSSLCSIIYCDVRKHFVYKQSSVPMKKMYYHLIQSISQGFFWFCLALNFDITLKYYQMKQFQASSNLGAMGLNMCF